MEELIDRLTALLRSTFPGSMPELEQATPVERVGGFLVWDGFDSVEQIDRQRQVSQVLRKELTPAERAQVTTILTLTPDEAMVMRGG